MFYSELQIGLDTAMRRLLNNIVTGIFLNAEIYLTLRYAVCAVQSSSNEALGIYRNLMCVIRFVVTG
jgi:hypothetical protein